MPQNPHEARAQIANAREYAAERAALKSGSKPAAGKAPKSSGWSWDADYPDKDPVDPRPIIGARINGGMQSPSYWSDESRGYVGTDRMRS